MLEGRSADIQAMSNLPTHSNPSPSLRELLRAGTLAEIQAAIGAGADVASFRDEHGYDAMQTVTFGCGATRDDEMPDLLRLLAAHGARLDGQSSHGESALSVLSRQCRFDAIRALLEIGAPEDLLAWTPLCREVAFGTLEDVRLRAAHFPNELEEKDRWSRTPFVLALALGRLDVAEMLLQAGAGREPTDHVGRPPIFHAVMSGRTDVVRWLLERGAVVDATDHGGSTSLLDAVEADDHAMVDFLLSVGADPNHEQVGFPALGCVESRAMAIRLMEAGADPSALRYEQQRLFLEATVAAASDPFEGLGLAEFERDRTRRFGQRNAQTMQVPFWVAMVRSGLTGYQAANRFGADTFDRARPIWCANRIGQSLTLLPDGRVVQVAGEHEDGYDPDFCIYNDVFVHHPDGRLEIIGYPESLFPPTDFHTATLVGDRIIVIGSLGYQDGRVYGTTPVFALSIDDWRIEHISVSGEGPGWIHKHRAILVGNGEIAVIGGKVLSQVGDEEISTINTRSFTLDLAARRWR
nr:ankyrin repeat domain-containing protein [uncultured Roseateles sp.]